MRANEPELDPTRGFRGGAHLRLLRVHGSWRNRFAHPIERIEALADARALVETRDGEGKGRVWIADLRAGTRVAKSDWATTVCEGLEQRIADAARRRNRREGRVLERAVTVRADTATRSDRLDSWPRYTLARVRYANGRAHASVFELGAREALERLRFGARWPAALSRCGLFCVYLRPGDRAAVIVRLEDGVRREVPVRWAGARVGELALRVGGAEVLVARVRSAGGWVLQCVSVVDGATRWIRSISPHEMLVGLSEHDALAWSVSPEGTLRAYALDDGSIARHEATGAATRTARLALDGRSVVLAGAHCVAGVDLASGETHGADEGPDASVRCLAWERSGARYAVLYGSGELHLRAHPGGALLARAETEGLGPGDRFVGLCFEPGSSRVLFGRVRNGGAGPSYLERVDLRDAVSLDRVHVSEAGLEAIDVAPEGSCAWLTARGARAATEPRLRELRLWSLLRGCVIATSRASGEEFVGFDPMPEGGALCATVTRTGTWEREYYTLSGSEVRRRPLGVENAAPRACDASVTTADRTRVVGVFERQVSFVLEGAAGAFRAQKLFAPGIDRGLCTGSALFAYVNLWHSEVELYSTETGTCLETLSLASAADEPTTLALAPDGAVLLVGTSAGVVLEYAVRR